MLELDPQIAKAVSSKPAEPIRAEVLSMMRAASNKPLAPPEWIAAQLQDRGPVD